MIATSQIVPPQRTWQRIALTEGKPDCASVSGAARTRHPSTPPLRVAVPLPVPGRISETHRRPPHTRHAELVSASIAPQKPKPRAVKWTLKQVQGDGREQILRNEMND